MQTLQVRGAPENPELADCEIGETIPRLEDGRMISPEEGSVLLDTWRLGVRVRALRGLVSEDVEMEDLPAGLHSRFADAAGVATFPELGTRLERARAEVRDILTRRRIPNPEL